MIAPEKVEFFEHFKEEWLGLTYDDVTLQTGPSNGEDLPQELDISSRFSRNIDLKAPFVSAAMDTVTEKDMAIEMGKFGGLGVIHYAMEVKEQKRQVKAVKKAVNGLIEKPTTVKDSLTLQDVLDLSNKNGHTFRTFPVLNSEGNLVGILSDKDFKYPDTSLMQVSEAMTPIDQVLTAQKGTKINEAYKTMQKSKNSTLPIIDDDGKLAGLYVFSDVKRIHRNIDNYNTDSNQQLITAAAVSTISKESQTMERIQAMHKFLDVIVLDTSDGDSSYAFRDLQEIKNAFPNLDIVVGNITNPKSALILAKLGADGIKVGQGSGSICTTRRETGIGTPQLTAVYNCASALYEEYPELPICADGGISARGHLAIAIGAMANSVMMGRVFGGSQEAPGERIIKRDRSKGKVLRGMGSSKSLESNPGSRERYATKGSVILPEGVDGVVPEEGPVRDVLQLCAIALRKGMRLTKSPNIEYLRQNGWFIRSTDNGLRESFPHDVEQFFN